jgi:hypothetical protein
MQNPGHYPWYTAITIRGSAADLAAFKEGWCVVDDGSIKLIPEMRQPPPAVLTDGPVGAREGMEAMTLIGIAGRLDLPPDCPPDNRAAKMLAWFAGPGRSPRHISADRWLTLRDAADLPADAAEETIAQAWLEQNPDQRASGEARLQRIRATGYAGIDLWMADHWGAMGLTIEDLDERVEDDQPCLVFSIIGNGGAPDLLMKQIARANPDLTFDMVIAMDPERIISLVLKGREDTRREIQTPEEYAKALDRLGFEIAATGFPFSTGAIVAMLQAPPDQR